MRRLLSLYRLLQEGIANSVRHARATRIALTVEAAEGRATRITLSDDGVGFDLGRAAGSPGEGRGLTNIRRRAEQMRGRIAIDTAPDEGTRLILTVPVAERNS